jgi:hydroxymethylpyrimidine/phosphomethylpyrimidine kinase
MLVKKHDNNPIIIMIPRILIIAGSDSGGGAGIQADIKTVSALGGFATTAITAITVQNTLGVHDMLAIPPAIIAAQIKAVLDDIGADAIKIGMLGDAPTIKIVAKTLANYPKIPIILDTVMMAKGGANLLQPEAQNALIQHLIPVSYLITPNIPEAESLASGQITAENMEEAASKLQQLGVKNVLLKGGHLTGDELTDVLRVGNETYLYPTLRLHTRNTHGTGCTMASAIATLYAKGEDLPQAVQKAQHYVHGAIANAPNFGNGHGPLWHGWQQNT